MIWTWVSDVGCAVKATHYLVHCVSPAITLLPLFDRLDSDEIHVVTHLQNIFQEAQPGAVPGSS